MAASFRSEPPGLCRTGSSGVSSAAARSSGREGSLLAMSVSEDAGQDPVQLGERVVADLDGALAAGVLELDFGAELALQFFHEVAYLRALSGFALFPGQPFRLEPLDERLDGTDRKPFRDHLFRRAAQVALVG